LDRLNTGSTRAQGAFSLFSRCGCLLLKLLQASTRPLEAGEQLVIICHTARFERG
jgi:hypothetical protein